MKRISLLLLILSLILCGCDGGDIGIIGGADGPTAILVGSEGESTYSERKPVRMVRLSGELYYDSGEVSENTPRCGILDGGIEKDADEYDIPTKDNTCNFDGASGYQGGLESEDEIEVPLDDSWVIFRKITDPEKDFSKYKHCFYIKGTMPHAATESEYVVLSNDKDITFSQVTDSMVSSSSNDRLDIYVIPVGLK